MAAKRPDTNSRLLRRGVPEMYTFSRVPRRIQQAPNSATRVIQSYPFSLARDDKRGSTATSVVERRATLLDMRFPHRQIRSKAIHAKARDRSLPCNKPTPATL
jgi:hypothetical protein